MNYRSLGNSWSSKMEVRASEMDLVFLLIEAGVCVVAWRGGGREIVLTRESVFLDRAFSFSIKLSFTVTNIVSSFTTSSFTLAITVSIISPISTLFVSTSRT